MALEIVYGLGGAMFAAVAIHQALGANWRSASFWGCFAMLVAGGSYLPDLASGILVLALAGLAAMGLKPQVVESVGPDMRAQSAARLGNRVFVPALAIPLVTFAGSWALPLTPLVWHPTD